MEGGTGGDQDTDLKELAIQFSSSQTLLCRSLHGGDLFTMLVHGLPTPSDLDAVDLNWGWDPASLTGVLGDSDAYGPRKHWSNPHSSCPPLSLPAMRPLLWQARWTTAWITQPSSCRSWLVSAQCAWAGEPLLMEGGDWPDPWGTLGGNLSKHGVQSQRRGPGEYGFVYQISEYQSNDGVSQFTSFFYFVGWFNYSLV